jgi:adenylate cyclase
MNDRLPRKLAAILYADVAEYSRLTGDDEDATHRTLSEYLDLIAQTIESDRGQVMHYAGDAVLAKFDAVINAISSAVSIQKLLAERNEDLTDERKVQFRIGVNLGDVIEDRGDIYGDGVNVAARLESLADPGGICISDAVRTAVGKKLDFNYEDLGEQEVKNIVDPVRAYKVKSGKKTTSATVATRLVHKLSDKPSIAVIPFRNLSGDPDQEYFSDGMSEEIINGLSRFRSFFVFARNSSFLFKEKNLDLNTIKEKLTVRYLVGGSVRKAGNQVRISVNLTDVSTNEEIWSSQYDGELDNIFDLQDEITRNVVATIEPKIRQTEIRNSLANRSDNLDAYDYYLKALPCFYTLTFEGTSKALEFLKSAIAIDPNYQRAQSLAAWCCTIRQTQGWVARDESEAGFAAELALKALKSGTDDPEVLWQSAYAAGFFGPSFSEYYPQLKRSIELNPNGAQGWVAYGLALLFSGKGEESIDKFETGIRLNPLDPLVYRPQMGLAMTYLCLGRYEESINWGKKALLSGPDYFPVLRTTAASLAYLGRLDEARKYIDRLGALFPESSIEVFQKNFPHRDPEYRRIFIEGLRKAGLPETVPIKPRKEKS